MTLFTLMIGLTFLVTRARATTPVLLAVAPLFPLVQFDDEAALNLNCGARTHLYEDRVMKMSDLHIGPGCSVGSSSIVLYDTTVHPGSTLGPLSFLMKGESLPARTRWAGIPAQRVVRRPGAAPE